MFTTPTACWEHSETAPWSEVIAQDSIMINVEAGKIYFVRGETTMGVVVARPKFTQVDEATGTAAVANL
jgi:hypothetical protein